MGTLGAAGLFHGVPLGPGLRAGRLSSCDMAARDSPKNTTEQPLAGSLTLRQEPHGEGRQCRAYVCRPSLRQPEFKSH